MDFNAELGFRIGLLQKRLEEDGLSAALVTSKENILYLTGKETGRLLVTRDGAYLWVKDLYKQLYSGLYSSRRYPIKVLVYRKDYVKKFLAKHRVKVLMVDTASVASHKNLRAELSTKIVLKSFVEEQRAIKSRYEIGLLKKSCGIASEGMKAAEDVVEKGVREIDAVAEIEKRIRTLGSETPPFNDGMLLASGPRGADIHARASCSRIGRGLVVVDLGAKYKGYYSDMTRTLPVGGLIRRERVLLEFVENLKDETIDSLKHGVVAGEVHKSVEDALKARGFDFYHSSGHGVGLQIHEKPNIGPESKDVLKEGMVFTIEPGIYVPRKYGIRFEDTVLLTKKGCRRLTG